MSDILGRLGDLSALGKDALIAVLAGVIDGLGQGTEFSGEQLANLGDLQQQLADIIRGGEPTEE